MFLSLTIWAITLITAILFASGRWWFPESAATHGETIDRQFVVTLIVTGVVFIAAQVALGYLIVRYRAKADREAKYTHGSNSIEVLWTVATAVLFFAMVLAGVQAFSNLYLTAAPEDAIPIEVTGQQFAWNIRYAGPDGKFGRTSPEMINDTVNPVGLDDTDPAALDDIVVPTMAVPVNRPIQLILKSKDVTHSFFVRELRIKQDTVPGMVIPIHFTANRTGTFEIACAELCGLGHHRMRSSIEVLSDLEYSEWLRERAEY